MSSEPPSPTSVSGEPCVSLHHDVEEPGESPVRDRARRRVRIGDATVAGAEDDAAPRKDRKRRKRRKVVINTTFCRYDLVRRIANDNGWVEDRDEDGEKGEFDIFWTDTSVMAERVMRLQNYQRINHFPGMHLISRKVHLSLTLGKMRKHFPEHFSFAPRTWSLKSERNQFRKYLASLSCKKTFIIKPSAGCQGKGIILTQDPLDLEEEVDDAVAQEYISKPLLIEGKKFDLRVYALVTSLRHPSVFVFNDGLVRLCTVDYSRPGEDNLDNVMMHLTNYAINKTNEAFVFNDTDSSGSTGHKRDFPFLNAWLEREGHSPAKVWARIDDVICKTICAALPQLAHVYNSCLPHSNDGYTCFEVLGFDLLLDQNLKPWLLEVNHSPSFHTDTPLDERIKFGVLSEAARILNIQTDARARDREREKGEFRRRIEAQARRNLAKKAGEGGEEELRQLEREKRELDEQERRRVEGMVAQKRKEEDEQLENFRRIYPAPDLAYQSLYDQFVDVAREANVPQTTQATAQREAEGRKERERQRERMAEEAALRRGPRPAAPQCPAREPRPRGNSAGALRGSPRDAVWRESDSEREKESAAEARSRAQARLAEQMERHRRRISLGPRLSVFQLREQYIVVPPGEIPGLAALEQAADCTTPADPHPAPGDAAGLHLRKPPPQPPPPQLQPQPSHTPMQHVVSQQLQASLCGAQSAVRAAAARMAADALPSQPAAQWPPQHVLAPHQCNSMGRVTCPIAYVAAPSTVSASVAQASASIGRQMPQKATHRVGASIRSRPAKR